jgi:hypothetical protein
MSVALSLEKIFYSSPMWRCESLNPAGRHLQVCSARRNIGLGIAARVREPPRRASDAQPPGTATQSPPHPQLGALAKRRHHGGGIVGGRRTVRGAQGEPEIAARRVRSGEWSGIHRCGANGDHRRQLLSSPLAPALYICKTPSVLDRD